jgi:tetratricopeptide (TPR) repeat protein
MAESGGVSEILGAGSEAGTESSVAEIPVDPTAAALAAEAAKSDPELAREATAYFRKQSHLIEVQTEHLHEQRAVNLSLLKLRRFDERLKVGLRVFVILVATIIGIFGAALIHDAVTSRSVVIDPFDAPPALAASGLSGKVVAAGLLDVLTKIQAANYASAEHRALSNAWTSELSIEIPETGLSIGELERALKTRFGHDQHIDGELVQTEKGGLALTVRGTGILPQTFTDDARNLDKLATEAGEYVYGQSQPGLWAAYLSNDRLDEAIRFARAAYATADPSERPYLLNAWGNAVSGKGGDGTMVEALRLYREAVRLKPDYWVGYGNVIFALENLGDEEGAVGEAEQMIKMAGGRPGRAPEREYEAYDTMVWDLPAEHAGFIADMESHGGVGTTTAASGAESIFVAQIEAQMHDVEAATQRLAATPVDEKNIVDVANAGFTRALLAEERHDLQSAAREWDSFALAYASPAVSTQDPNFLCFAAVAYERNDQPAKADAALNSVGKLHFVDCYRFRGDVLELRGDWAGAQDWYEKAVKLAPSIPSGYYSWGAALAKHGDLPRAAAKFRDANQKGPHWADPLKAWGDVLLRQDKPHDALAKYSEALKYAPNWKELKEARETLAKVTR